jgi:alpha-ribazole phosphatase
MSTQVLLVRHPPVAKAWAGRCYGRSDMGWSREGAALARRLATELAAEPFETIVHSGALRTRRLAGMVARLTGRPVHDDPRWLERDFGTWEGRRWDAIWRETGDLMDRMMTHPRDFRPGGGETGLDLARRARAAWDALPRRAVLVIGHGGPIAAIRTHLAGLPLERMIEAVPPCGAVVRLPRDGSAHDA